MAENHQIRKKSDLLAILKRAGVSPETIAALDEQLPDDVDVDEHAQLLQRYGITRDALTSRMGASP